MRVHLRPRSYLALAALLALPTATVNAQGTPGSPLPGLTQAERSRFDSGKGQFELEEDAADGVGPVFNATSCAACHAGPATGGSSETLATRIGTRTRRGFDPLLNLGGPTLQVNGIGAVTGANFVGEIVPPAARIVARRRSNPIFGFGLVDAVPDSAFIDLARAQKRTSPATAGRPNFVTNLRTGRLGVGRFGWKAQVGSLYDFAADAYKDEMGVTTGGFTVQGITNPDGSPAVFPFARSDDGRSVAEENPPQGNVPLLAFDPVPGPDEPDDFDVKMLADFMGMLAPPSPLRPTPQSREGASTFDRIGCTSCHTPTLTTGPNAIAALSRKTFQPYSDFLLHDMGKLGDGIESGAARGEEMRTAPLWGLRDLPFYLHDGRATTIEQAIRLHDGQGKVSATRFGALKPAPRANLLLFLRSL